MKIRIIGSCGSGKSSLSREISKHYGIPYYELDNVIWDRSEESLKYPEEIRNKTLKYAFRSVFLKYENKLMNNEEIVNTFGPTEEEIIKLNMTNKDRVDSAIEHYYRIYEEFFHEMVVMPDENFDLIKDLFQQNIKMAIITGKSRRCLDICLKNLGISDFFITSITGDEVTKPKPDPEGIYKAIQLMDLKSHEVVFVGDSNADIMAGKSANIITIGAHWFETVQTTNFSMEPDYIFTRTENLKSLINKMNEIK
jgi:pyrophosphatase PpaX